MSTAAKNKIDQPIMTIEHSTDDNLSMIKGNVLIDSWFDANLSEYMLIQASLYLISQKNENKEYYDANTTFKITVDDFCKIWGYDNKTGVVTHNLKDIGVSIMQKGFWYRTLDTSKLTFSNWFSQISPLENGALTFAFPPALIPYLKMVSKKFTWFDLKQMRKLRKVYAIRIYEMLSQNKYSIGQSSSDAYVANNEFTITVEDLRARFVLQKKYKLMADFRKRVIDEPIKEIKDKTGLNVVATPVKNGKNIIAFKFTYKFPNEDLDFKSAFGIEDKKRDPDTPDMFNLMTDKTRKTFASKLTKNVAFGSKYGGLNEDPKPFENRIYEKMKDPEFIAEIQEFLDQEGYDPNFAENNKKK